MTEAEELQHIRKTVLGFNQKRIGEIVGMHPTSISRMETGELPVNSCYLLLLRMFERFGIPDDMMPDMTTPAEQ